jgi:ABC-type sugar transport system ATPase subunit
MVFQAYAPWPHVTVADHVAFALRRRKLRRRAMNGASASAAGRHGLSRLVTAAHHRLSSRGVITVFIPGPTMSDA